MQPLGCITGAAPRHRPFTYPTVEMPRDRQLSGALVAGSIGLPALQLGAQSRVLGGRDGAPRLPPPHPHRPRGRADRRARLAGGHNWPALPRRGLAPGSPAHRARRRQRGRTGPVARVMKGQELAQAQHEGGFALLARGPRSDEHATPGLVTRLGQRSQGGSARGGGRHQPKLTQERDLVIVDAILEDAPIAHLPDVAEGKPNAPACGRHGPRGSSHRPSVGADKYPFRSESAFRTSVRSPLSICY